MDAQHALAIGLIDVLCEPGTLQAEVQAYAERLAEKPANALAAIRRCLVDGGSRSFDDGLSVEKEEANRLAAHENFKIGIDAFLNKAKAGLDVIQRRFGWPRSRRNGAEQGSGRPFR